MQKAGEFRSTKTALVQIWLTVLPLLALVVLWPSARGEAPTSTVSDGQGVPFVSSDGAVIIQTHAPVVVGWALVVLGVGLSVAAIAMFRGSAVKLHRLSVLGRVALVVVAVGGGAFASLPVQAHLLGWSRGEVPAAVPWWSNATFSWTEMH